MRKGADCLSKWVGEAERQLRILFDQAYRMQPSIIFFDEIDGLAPVRSSKQEQIHSSIVSTLLALLDGLDDRGQVIVIGATNRIDNIDPALRRPGRFDREFLFNLPPKEARKDILMIHTKSWNPPPSVRLVNLIAEKTVGYCGADLKALCAEATLRALRRIYPQIYSSTDKLLLDLNQISIIEEDFLRATKEIVPCSFRSSVVNVSSLADEFTPLLQGELDKIMEIVHDIFVPKSAYKIELKKSGETKIENSKFFVSEDFLQFKIFTHRPRLLLFGKEGMGQGILSSAVLSTLERFPMFSLDLASIYMNISSHSLEECIVQAFQEAKKKSPSIIYIPNIDSWWSVATNSLKLVLVNLLNDLDPSVPILLFSNCISSFNEIDPTLQNVFTSSHELREPKEKERKGFFHKLLDIIKEPIVIR